MDPLEEIFEGTGLEYSKPKRPYPGLRPFEKDEWPIFYGREKMTGEIIDRLISDHLVVVHGDSGGGKSSVARAGVQAQLEREHATSGQRWRTVTAMPGNAPLSELAEAIASLRPDVEESFLNVRRALNTGHDAAAGIIDFLAPGKNDRICIVIDQFEELFDFLRRNPDGYAEAKLLVDFLIGLARSKEQQLFVMLTMRSDYVGACARFRDFAEVVNDTLYLLSGMSDGALMRAVRDPGSAYGIDVSSDLARELIAAAGRGQDKLPLLQHGLLQIYEAREEQISALPPEKRPLSVNVSDIREDEKDLAKLLSDHGDLVWRAAITNGEIEELSQDEREKYAEKVFRALIDKNADGLAVRRRLPLAQLALESGLNTEQARKIIRPFRADGVSFFRPFGRDTLTADDQIDVSHESLIRQWTKLRELLEAEAYAGAMWADLLRAMDRREEFGLVTGRRLAALQSWVGQEKPTEFWAGRYGGRFEEAERFLDDCEEENRKQERRKKLMIAASVFGLIALPTGYATGIYLLQGEIEAAQLAAGTETLRAEEATQFAENAEARAQQAQTRAEQAQARAQTETKKANEVARRATEEAERTIGEARSRIELALAREAEVRAESDRMIAENQRLANRSMELRKGSEVISGFAGDVMDQITLTSLDKTFDRANTPDLAQEVLAATYGDILAFETRVGEYEELQSMVERDSALALGRTALARAEWHKLQGRTDCALAETREAQRLAVGGSDYGGNLVPPNCQLTVAVRTADQKSRARVRTLLSAQAAAEAGYILTARGELDEAAKSFGNAIAHSSVAIVDDSRDAALLRSYAYAGLGSLAAARRDADGVRTNAQNCRSEIASLKPSNLPDSTPKAEPSRFEFLVGLECIKIASHSLQATNDENARSGPSNDAREIGEVLNFGGTAEDYFASPANVSKTVDFLLAANLLTGDKLLDDLQMIGFYRELVDGFKGTPVRLLQNGQSPTSPDLLFDQDLVRYIRSMERSLTSKASRHKSDRSLMWRDWAEWLILYRSLLDRDGWADWADELGLQPNEFVKGYQLLQSDLEAADSEPSPVSVLLLATEVATKVSASRWHRKWPEDDQSELAASSLAIVGLLASQSASKVLTSPPFSTPAGTVQQLVSGSGTTSPSRVALRSALGLCSNTAIQGVECARLSVTLQEKVQELDVAARELGNALRPLVSSDPSNRVRRGRGEVLRNPVGDAIAFEGIDLVASLKKLESEGLDVSTRPEGIEGNAFDYSSGLPAHAFKYRYTAAEAAAEAVAMAEGAAAHTAEAVEEAVEAVAETATEVDETAGELIQARLFVAPVVRGSAKFSHFDEETRKVYLFEAEKSRNEFIENRARYVAFESAFGGRNIEFIGRRGGLIWLLSADTVEFF